MEGRTLIFLYTDTLRAIFHLNDKHPRTSFGWQVEIYSSHTKVVRLSLFLRHHLIVGIAQYKCQCALTAHRLLDAVFHFVSQGRCLHFLSRTIDAAIGKDGSLFHQLLGLIKPVVLATSKHYPCLVGIGIGKHTVAISRKLFDTQLGIGYGRTSGGIHHHIAHLATGLCLGHGINISHVIQHALHFGGRGCIQFN